MCMICKGLKRNKFSPEDAKDKLEEFVDLELIDEEHQELVEGLISELEEEEYYWITAKKSMRKYEDTEEQDGLEEDYEEVYESYEDDDSIVED